MAGKDVTSHGPNGHQTINQFAENPWGAKVRETVTYTAELQDRHWAVIHEHCAPYMRRGNLVENGGEDGATTIPQASILIGW